MLFVTPFRRRLVTLFIFSCIIFTSHAQRVFVNTPVAIYELTGGNCTAVELGAVCGSLDNGIYFSIAFHNNTLYYISGNTNNIYQVNLSTHVCTFLTSIPANGPFPGATTLNSLTVDKNGILYAADLSSSALWSYNPATNQRVMLGTLPVPPAGDLMFYRNKLIYAALGGFLYEVNLADVSSSQPYMSTSPYEFYGIISFPAECGKNKVYGISSTAKLVELDLENKTIVGETCVFPWLPYDAASEVEDGNTIGVSVDSILVYAVCDPAATTGAARVVAHTAATGDLTYTLDNIHSNTTGSFGNIGLGTHTLRITNNVGCFKDTTITIDRGLAPIIQVNKTDPESCDVKNGSIVINATSNYSLLYSLDNGLYQSVNSFSGLAAGRYLVSIRDEGHCQRDTFITLNYRIRPSYIQGLQIDPTHCSVKSGSIKVLSNIAGLTASLNNGPVSSSMIFSNLDAGNYMLSVFKANNCRYDTLIQIAKVEDPIPTIQLTTGHQICFENNGSITVSATGVNPPYMFSLDNTIYSANNVFSQLAPLPYIVYVRNTNGCTWSIPAEVTAYPKQPYTHDLRIKTATCEEPTSGEITLAVSGPELPYSILFDRRSYPATTTFSQLNPGKYSFAVLNKDGCIIDTIRTEVTLTWSPQCDLVFMPSAFTPNKDGLNDLIYPQHSAFLSNTVFTVYNRHGQIMYQGKKAFTGWDGNYRGKPQPPGVYVWTFSYEDSKKVPQLSKGHLTLVR